MAIFFDQERGIFTLHTAHTTYQMQADRYGFLLHLYYGARTAGHMDYLLTYADRGFSGVPHELGEDRTYSLDALPQEFPVWGQGDFRSAALMVRDGRGGAYGCDLRYAGHEVTEGKYTLEGLPAAFGGQWDQQAGCVRPGYTPVQTLRIDLRDAVLGLRVTLLYGVFEACDVITRAVVVTNEGARELIVEKLLSANLDLVSGSYDVLTFYGRHAMERMLERQPVRHGEFTIGSRRGMSSHQYNPLLILCDRDATEDAGRCWAMEFVYSGGFFAGVGKDQYDQTRMQMGLFTEQFSYPLAGGQSLTGPEVLLSYSCQGLTDLSHNLHTCIRRHILRKPAERPEWNVRGESVVLINSWEAAYFDFDAETVLRLAREAKQMGMNMVVMDDGWFGQRSDDRRALGDWQVNEQKLGCTLGELTRRVRELDMAFGIWIEPEMISENSRLYREHPDWVLALPGRAPQLSRSQLVLDFSRPEVVERIWKDICGVIDQADISYIKWDYNRSIMDVFSAATADQGKVLYDYVLGLYAFARRLRERYPHILIEGCSGGGGRFDAGMLYYTPQIWCSDNTDAVDRLLIQHGTSFGYPPETMGAHISVSPNEQNGRVTPLAARSVVAAAGTFGCELDPAKLTQAQKREVAEQIAAFKRLQARMGESRYYRLTDPATERVAAWEMISQDDSLALVGAVVLKISGNMPREYVRLKGLDPEAMYREESLGRVFPGSALMEMGLPLPIRLGEYQAHRFLLEKVKEW